MAVARFKARPIEIEAIQFTGRNDKEVLAFCPECYDPRSFGPCIVLVLSTLDKATAWPGDWIVKTSTSEFSIVRDLVFKDMYDRLPAQAEFDREVK